FIVKEFCGCMDRLNYVDCYTINVYVFKEKSFTMVWWHNRGCGWCFTGRYGGCIMDDCVGITLIRHGMTKENERSAYIGWSDSPLSEKGRDKVESYSELWKNNSIEYVFSSDLVRCVETANILFPHQPLQKIRNLREMNFGKWEKKTYEELKNIPAYREWLDHMFVSGPDDGEDFPTFSKRVEA